MKRTLTVLSLVLVMTLALAACSTANKDNNTAQPNTTQSARPSNSVTPAPDDNDAANGGGAGGTNDLDNDGEPDRVPSQTPSNNAGANNSHDPDATGDGVLGEAGDAVGDVVEGAGEAVDDAARGVGRAFQGR